MSKEAVKVVKIQTCVLKVNIHCDGCKHKVKKLLQKIEGVYSTTIDAEQGKVTVEGNVDPNSLIKKLQKKGKHAELWPSKGGNNQLNKQLQGMQIGNGKGQKDGKPQKGQQQQQQQMKGSKDLNLPQFKDMKLPFKDKKSVKFNLDDDYDDGDDSDDGLDDDYEDDDEFDDDFDFDPDELKAHLKTKAMNGHGQQHLPMDAHAMNDKKGSGGGNGKKGGGGGDVHAQNKGMGGNNDAKNGNGGKKGGGNNGGGQNQGGGGGAAKNGGSQGNKNGGTGGGNNNAAAAGGKKGGGGKNDVGHGFPEMLMSGGGGNVGQMGNIPVGQMGNFPAVQGLPAAPAMNAGGYFQSAGPEILAGNPYYQQQYAAAMMMQQQRQNGMYARPPMPVAYMPQAPPPHAVDPYAHYFSDENANGCAIM